MQHIYSKIAGGCVVALLCGAPLLATQSNQNPSAQASKYLAEMATHAKEIESHAMRMERLSKDPKSSWAQYDQEWNQIKPDQEALQMEVTRLNALSASLTDSQRKTLAGDVSAVARISAQTRELLNFIDQPGADLKSPGFRSHAQAILSSAQLVARGTGS